MAMIRILGLSGLSIFVSMGLCGPLVMRERFTTDSTSEELDTKVHPRKGVEDVDDAKNYLKNFGYMTKKISMLKTEAFDETEEAIKRFQKIFNLNVTGQLNNDTLHLMNYPRCGLPDISISGSNRRQKRYKLQEGWHKSSLTYFILNYPSKTRGFFTIGEIDKVIDESFMIWTEHSNLDISKSQNRYWSDLQLGFYSLDHRDGYSFDGPGNILGHAFFPEEGQIHMDDDETWSPYGQAQLAPTNGRFISKTSLKRLQDLPRLSASLKLYDLRRVLGHEVGHALGLDHTNDSSALMYPYYRADSLLLLGDDDVMGLRKLYGSKSSSPTARTPSRAAVGAPVTTTMYKSAKSSSSSAPASSSGSGSSSSSSSSSAILSDFRSTVSLVSCLVVESVLTMTN